MTCFPRNETRLTKTALNNHKSVLKSNNKIDTQRYFFVLVFISVLHASKHLCCIVHMTSKTLRWKATAAEKRAITNRVQKSTLFCCRKGVSLHSAAKGRKEHALAVSSLTNESSGLKSWHKYPKRRSRNGISQIYIWMIKGRIQH